ncbi:hypothetical protein SAMN05877809_10218 [Rhodobacter sp. JA431]|uniref:hypothetical protein n=1 Tax=Rhodobacter sp. JA431 TaxID=570013 RepID=UPI000BD1E3AF|nr:hypothetical protein [Rhodobacter sp. JA431]SOB97695.1 hypothetical protein SAMN05877809_10218 [Rhodobacter sp. JA431]
MELFAFLIVVGFYIYAAAAAYWAYPLFVAFYAFFIIFNDFLLLQFFYEVNSPYALLMQAWQEIFLVIGFTRLLFLRHQIEQRIGKDFIWISIIAIIGIGVAFLNGDGLSEIYGTTRRYIFPFLLPCIFFMPKSSATKNYTFVFTVILCASAFSIFYAIWIEWRIGTNYKELWFYDFVAERKLALNTAERLIQYQFLRDGSLRATGVLISSVEYSFLSALMAIVAFIGLVRSKNNLQVLLLLCVLMANICAIFMSQTRSGLILFIFATALYALARIFDLKNMIKLAWIPGLFAGLFLMIVAASPGMWDASTRGRIIQYFSVLTEFRPQGYGTGAISNNSPTYRDTLYVSVLNTYGIFSVIYFGLIFRPLRILSDGFRQQMLRRETRIWSEITVYLILASIFVYAFHYSVGGKPYYLTFLFAYIARAKLTNEKPI